MSMTKVRASNVSTNGFLSKQLPNSLATGPTGTEDGGPSFLIAWVG